MIIRDQDRGGGDFASGMMLGTGLGLMAGKQISSAIVKNACKILNLHHILVY